MDINYIREFVIVGQSRSIQEASKKLYLVPSTLSRHLAALEKEVGVQLIHRTTTDFQLTPEGEVFLEKAIAIVNSYDATINATQTKAQEKNPIITIGGNLRISTIQMIAMDTITYSERIKEAVTPVLHAPHTTGTLTNMSVVNPGVQAFEGVVDLSLLIGPAVAPAGYVSQTILTEKLCIAFSEKHPLAQEEGPVDLADFAKETLVGASAYPRFLESCLEAFLLCGIEPNVSRHVFRTFGNVFVERGTRSFYLLPEGDAYRVPPQSLSGLVVKRLVNECATYDIVETHAADAPAAVKTIARNTHYVSEVLAKTYGTYLSLPTDA